MGNISLNKYGWSHESLNDIDYDLLINSIEIWPDKQIIRVKRDICPVPVNAFYSALKDIYAAPDMIKFDMPISAININTIEFINGYKLCKINQHAGLWMESIGQSWDLFWGEPYLHWFNKVEALHGKGYVFAKAYSHPKVFLSEYIVASQDHIGGYR